MGEKSDEDQENCEKEDFWPGHSSNCPSSDMNNEKYPCIKTKYKSSGNQLNKEIC
jgi:hypothetical protein